MSRQDAAELAVMGSSESSTALDVPRKANSSELSNKDEVLEAAPPPAPAPAYVVQDGGWAGWMTVLGSWFVSAVCFGYVNAFGVYETYYIERLLPSYSSSSIAWIGSFQAWALFAMGMVTGPLFDLGYFRHMMIFGTVLYVGTLFAQAQVQQDAYWQVFLSQGIGQGIAMGTLFLPSMAVIGHHFQKKRAMAMGIAVTGSSTGGLIFPILINNVFNNNGYVWGVRAAGFYILGCCVIGNLLMRPKYPPRHTKPPMPSILKLLQDPPYIVAICGLCLGALGVFYVFFFLQLYTQMQGISTELSFYTLTILNGASIFGRTIPNLIADRVGVLPIMVVTVFITGAIVFAMFGVHSVAGVVIFALVYGFFSGGFISLLAPLWAVLSDNYREMGIRMGLGLFIVGIAALVGTPIDGALIGNAPNYTWWKAQVFSGVVLLVGSGFLLTAMYLLAKKRGKPFPW